MCSHEHMPASSQIDQNMSTRTLLMVPVVSDGACLHMQRIKQMACLKVAMKANFQQTNDSGGTLVMDSVIRFHVPCDSF